ncbi:MAG TPA: amino acid ABC transporter substrate-binding protein [Alphaproteobacteria bacterium]
MSIGPVRLSGGVRFAALVALLALVPTAALRAAEPLTVGFSMSSTGGLASPGRSALLAMKVWEDDTNAKGGLLGRPVKLVYYDDQSNPGNVPGLYTKLLDVDKVDLVIGPYGTVMTAPAMPVVMAHNKVVISLTALAVNRQFKYPKYFSMVSLGPKPSVEMSRGFFAVAAAQTPKPRTVAIAAADSEFALNASEGARESIQAAGFKIVYDKAYPPATTDFTPIVRAVQAANPDIFFMASYPTDSVGLIRAINEVGFKPKLLGGAMAGLQATPIKLQLGPLLNGVITFENWLPAPGLMNPAVTAMLKTYQARAVSEGVDPLGYFLGPNAYAELQILGEAVAETGGVNDDKIADYLRIHTFKTVFGEVRFGPDGEWVEPRQIYVQFRNITGNGIEQFTDPAKEPVLDPPSLKSGTLIYPYADALK